MNWQSIVEYARKALFTVLGVLGTEGFRLVRSRLQRSKMKNALCTEMAEAKRYLVRNQYSLEDLIQLIAISQLPAFGPVKIPTHIYDMHYSKLCMQLTEHERMSFTAIYERIRKLNELAEKFGTLVSDCARDRKATIFYELAQLLDTQYRTTIDLILFIDWHLAHKDSLETVESEPTFTRTGWDELTRKADSNLLALANEARSLGVERLKHKLAARQ